MLTDTTIDQNLDSIPLPENEMFIDTDSFDVFSSLDDLKVEEKVQPQENVEEEDTAEHEDVELAEDEGVEDDAEDGDYEDEEFDFDDIEDEDEDGEAEEDEAEEDEEDSEADDSEDGEDLDEDEDEEVDYEGYEVTLPNGEVVKLDEAVKGYKAAEALEQEREAFAEEVESFRESSKGINKALDLAKLEADRVIEDYADFDWATLSHEDPKAYVENREFLDRYVARRKELVAEINEREEREAETKKAEMQTKARECVAELQNAIPGWNEKVYQELVDYAVENGADRSEMLMEVNPVTFKVLHKAMQFEKGAKVVKAKVKKAVKSPKKVTKSQAAKPGNAKQPSKKTIVAKKAAAGNWDSPDVFNFLDD